MVLIISNTAQMDDFEPNLGVIFMLLMFIKMSTCKMRLETSLKT